MKRSAWIAAIIALAACSGAEDTKKQPEMTQRQRDSAIGASGLPGAQGVTRALQVSDSAAARRAREDSLQ